MSVVVGAGAGHKLQENNDNGQNNGAEPEKGPEKGLNHGPKTVLGHFDEGRFRAYLLWWRRTS